MGTEIPFLLGAAFLNQTTRGTAETMATIGSGSGSGSAIDNVTDGAVLGDAGSGVGDTGISFSFGKKLTEKAVLTGSYTRDFGNFSNRTIEGLSIVIPIKGNGGTTAAPPVATDFTPDVGIAALLRAAGLTGAAQGARWEYTPASTALITAALYIGDASNNGMRVIVKDIEAVTATFNFTPGEAATLEFDLSGEYDSADEGGTWTSTPFDYGNQSSLSAPFVKAAAFTWGPNTPTARALGFSELTITLDNQSETVPSSNATSGETQRQTGRDVTISGTFDADSAEMQYELNQLGESAIANAEQLMFTIGTVAGPGNIANAYRITVDDPELISLEQADPLGNSHAWTIELKARSATADGEFKFDYR